ncbi:DUF1501 domain-containing protein, partial [Lacticaseibacillus rhamnosus]
MQNDLGKEKMGRDHNTYGFSHWMAGGGMKAGYIHGETDEFGHKAIKDIVHHYDWHATLLHLIAAMDRPSSGSMRVLGHSLGDMSDREIAHWRNEHIGFIFQQFNLIPVLTALENVELPLKLTNLKKAERREHAMNAL